MDIYLKETIAIWLNIIAKSILMTNSEKAQNSANPDSSQFIPDQTVVPPEAFDGKAPIAINNNEIYEETELTTNVREHLAIETTAQNIGQGDDCYNFCVITGSEYILKVIALHDSLQKHCKNFNLWLCCMDYFTFSLLQKMNLKGVILLKVEEIEDDRLRKVKAERKINEYCWTLKAPLIEYLLLRYDIKSIVYCDGDIFFFSDPKPIFDEWGDYSAFLCPQRDLEWVQQKYGKYQAGLIGFKKDSYGLESLKWWKEKCLEWCSIEPDLGLFGDQKYLDHLPIYFPRIKISEHLGINAAPWNCVYNNNYKLSKRKNQLYIEDYKVVAYHFACISIFNESEFDLWSLGELTISSIIINEIYVPYLEKIMEIIERVKSIDVNGLSQCLSTRASSQAKTFYKYSKLKREMDQWEHYFNFTTIISQEYLIKGLALYYSLKAQIDNFHIWICCMDSDSYNVLNKMNLEHASLIHVKDIENEELLKVKSTRKLNEYCWTLKAPLCLYVLDHNYEANHIIYCDADMHFFANPKPILDEWAKYSILLCKQRGTYELEKKHGIFQAGLIGFKRDLNSIIILNWWKDKCIDNCFDVYDTEFERWGDQKYLDYIPLLFTNIKLIDQKGIDAAPWNLVMNNNYSVIKKENKVFVDDCELISYHFGSTLIFDQDNFDLWKLEPLTFDESIINNIYLPYLKCIKHICETLKTTMETDISHLYADPGRKNSAQNYFNNPSWIYDAVNII